MRVELGAGDRQGAAGEVGAVEVADRERNAVGGEQQVGAPQERRRGREQVQLDRPLPQR